MYKVGDRVKIVPKKFMNYNIRRGTGTINRKCPSVPVIWWIILDKDGIEENYFEEDLVLEVIHDSPLFKALLED
jgi:hypothetical protein